MKHSIEELYTIEGQRGIYSEDYLDKHFVKVAPKARLQEKGEAYRLLYRVNTGTLNVHTANGVKVIYTIGEKTRFDTEEEHDAERKANSEKRAEQARRREALAKLDGLTTKQLETLVKRLGL